MDVWYLQCGYSWCLVVIDMNIPRPTQPTNELAAWLNKMQRYVKSSAPKSGAGTLVNVTPDGSVIKSRKNLESFRYGTAYGYEEYSRTKGYAIGTMVRITASFVYNYSSSGAVVTASIPQGSYMCVAKVPPFFTPSELSAMSAAMPTELSASYNNAIRKNTWIYAPITPEPTLRVAQWDYATSGSTSDYKTNQHRFWEQIGTAQTASAATGSAGQMFQISTIGQGDYFTATAVGSNPVVTGSIKIAKSPRLRPSVTSEVIDGVTVTYGSYVGDNQRTANDGTNTEIQVPFPRYVSGISGSNGNGMSIIFAMPVNDTGLTFSGSAITWVEVSPARVWARRYAQ